MGSISYADFVDRSHEPRETELVCRFFVVPAEGLDAADAAGRVASESSNGTWAELEVEGSVTDLSATAFAIEAATAGQFDGYEVGVAYPDALFEHGNVAQVLSCIAGNILGMKAVDRIRLLDCDWPEPLATSFPGPAFGSVVREAIFDALDRVDAVADAGGEYVMVDVVTAGWAAVQQLRERCERHGLAIHAHRAMHSAFDRHPSHGVSMRVLAQIARLCGVDHIHTGTAGLGKMANEDTVGINEWLASDLHGLNDVLPVASGGLHPGVVPPLVDALGTNICVQAGGGVHGHPDGTHAGAKALRAAVDVTVAGDGLETKAEDVPELDRALEKWGTETPR